MDFRSLASSSRGNAYLLTSGTSRLLLECGLHLADLQRRAGHQLGAVDACLVTHEHMDHARSAAGLLRIGVEVWTSAGTAAALGLEGHGLHVLRDGVQVQIGPYLGPWTVLPFDAVHDAAEPLGFLISDGVDKLLFATDTAYLPWRFHGLTMIAIECNWASDLLGDLSPERRARLEGAHMGLEQVQELLAANDLSHCRSIHLLHLSRAHSDAARFKTEIERQTGIPVVVEEE
jgi:phosphoribosyl 1,2-cyclic phosphodiesterase